ncbi:MAG: hypothetical protein M3R57_07760 [Chloroflexota bacterium]|nr:hypothetical protein [Chloroflexota bacterium]
MSPNPNEEEIVPTTSTSDIDTLTTIATADPSYGWPWDIAVVFVAYVVLRLIGIFRRTARNRLR